jgi:hypothetical protein
MENLEFLSREDLKTVLDLAANAAIERSKHTTGHSDVPFPPGWDSEPSEDYRELVVFIEGLSNDSRAELAALTWLGREDDLTEIHFAGLVHKAESERPDAGYLADKALNRYLRDGLRKLGLSL